MDGNDSSGGEERPESPGSAYAQRIAEKIQALGDNPDDPSLDIQRLSGRAAYRLRVGG